MAADWPGFFPRGPEVVAVLIAAGADPSAPVEGSWHAETPLHWAASSDDVEVARALIDGGADIEATGAFALTESVHVPAATGSTLVFRPITIERRAPAIACGHVSA
jgi:ankyrin repeat protein